MWFHRFQYDTSVHIFYYNLQVAGIAEMAFRWTQQNPLSLQACKTIYLMSKLHPKCHDIWLKLSLPIFRLDFGTCSFLPSFQCFLVVKKVVEPLEIVIFLLENQITTPKPFHAKILNYWDFLRRRTPPFYLSLYTSSQASSPKVSHMPWNNAIHYFRAN